MPRLFLMWKLAPENFMLIVVMQKSVHTQSCAYPLRMVSEYAQM